MTDVSATRERNRILEAYARREVDGRDAGAYFALEDEAHLLRLQQRQSETLRLLDSAGLGDLGNLDILDIGCGEGRGLLELVLFGAAPERLAGIDLRGGPVARAAERLPTADLRQGCASRLPWTRGSFDLVLFSTVFSSLLDDNLRARLAREAARALSVTGAILCYDTLRENPRNPDARPLLPGQLDRLFPGFTRRSVRLTFLPHLARRLPRGLLRTLYPLLAALPPWQSHHLSLLTRQRA